MGTGEIIQKPPRQDITSAKLWGGAVPGKRTSPSQLSGAVQKVPEASATCTYHKNSEFLSAIPPALCNSLRFRLSPELRKLRETIREGLSSSSRSEEDGSYPRWLGCRTCPWRGARLRSEAAPPRSGPLLALAKRLGKKTPRKPEGFWTPSATRSGAGRCSRGTMLPRGWPAIPPPLA